jgi:hypothetical protein
MTSPNLRDDGGGLGSALDPASSDPEPVLLVAYRQALWQSESRCVW